MEEAGWLHLGGAVLSPSQRPGLILNNHTGSVETRIMGWGEGNNISSRFVIKSVQALSAILGEFL